MQVIKSIGVLLVASLGHVSLTQAQEISIRPLPTNATTQQGKTEVLAVPAAATAAHVAEALPIQQIWTLTTGVTIKENLEAWAEKAQWRVIWPKTLKTWIVPNEMSFTGSFADAAEKVILTLAENGALVRIRTFEGNKTIVISGPGQAQQ